jgi:hypothetical protein
MHRTFMLYPESGQLSISHHMTTGNYNFWHLLVQCPPPPHMTEQCGAGTVISHYKTVMLPAAWPIALYFK